APTPPSLADQLADPASWLPYFQAYQQYFDQVIQFAQAHPGVTPVVPQLSAPAPVAGPLEPGPIDNSPSPVSASKNTIPLLLASLTSEDSSSYRIVAGADLSSANPLALQSASQAIDGSVTLDG